MGNMHTFCPHVAFTDQKMHSRQKQRGGMVEIKIRKQNKYKNIRAQIMDYYFNYT